MKHPRIPESDEPIKKKMREFQPILALKNPIYWLIDCRRCPVHISSAAHAMAFQGLINSAPPMLNGRSSHGTRKFKP